MNNYWIGLATIPAAILIYFLVATAGAWLIGKGIKLATMAMYRFDQSESEYQARQRAGAIYGAESGLVLAVGKLGIILIYGKVDRERMSWFSKRLMNDAPLINARLFVRKPKDFDLDRWYSEGGQ